MYEIDAAGVTLALYNVAVTAVGYCDTIGSAQVKEPKEDFEAGKLSRKVMSTHGKFLAKVITGNRSPHQFTPLRSKSQDLEEIPQPAVLPRPIPIE